MTTMLSLWRGEIPPLRRDKAGRIIRSYEEKQSRGWIKPVRERFYTRPSFAEKIIADVAQRHLVSVETLCSRSHRPCLALARFEAMALLRQELKADGSPRLSLPHIGSLLGGRDHSSVASGLKRWKQIEAERLAKEAA